MDGKSIFLAILVCHQFLLGDRVQCSQSMSKNENIDTESQFKHLNNTDIKNTQILPEPYHNIVSARKYSQIDSTVKHSGMGILPVRIIAKEDLMGMENNLDSKKMKVMKHPHTFLAVARTKVGAGKYAGGGGDIGLHNPKVVGQQVSTTRIRLQSGSESIEVGWRVDPMLYGDSKTHFFIRTDAGQSHCFYTHCPGFNLTDPHFKINGYFNKISKPGGPLYDFPCYIIRDKKNGNWNLLVGAYLELVGHWPSNIFKMGLVDQIEFGGAVYSPPGTSLPPMGSSNLPIGNHDYDGYIYRMKIMNENGEAIKNFELELYADNFKLYFVVDKGKVPGMGRMILYGGPGHPL